MRAIKVTFSNGDIITTSMAAHLTNQQMLDYYKIGKWFNIGCIGDNMQQVVKAEIIR